MTCFDSQWCFILVSRPSIVIGIIFGGVAWPAFQGSDSVEIHFKMIQLVVLFFFFLLIVALVILNKWLLLSVKVVVQWTDTNMDTGSL